MCLTSWFDFPVSVFIDTQVYINESYNFGEKGNLSYFHKLILEGKIIHLTSEIVVGEVEKHIRKDVSEALKSFNKVVDDRKLAVFRKKAHEQLQKINEAEMVEEAVSIFKTYLSDTKAVTLDSETIDLGSVISDYFESKKPFGIKKDKKNEFPDAFNISMLRKYAMENRPVLIVSGDEDFFNEDEEDLFCFKKLSELLDAINSQNNITQSLKEYLERKNQYIFDEVKLQLMDNDYKLEVDGTDTDRKGCQHGFEYEEVELISVVPRFLKNIEVVHIDLSDEMLTVSLDCKAKLEFSCSFFDEENSAWDSVDKEYSHTHHGTMHEVHNALIPVTIVTAFKKKSSEDISFNIDEVIIDTNIELDQFTLQNDGRSRMDNLYRCWDDDDDEFDAACPNCGCEMTFENDAVNGFCIECEPN